ncbi:MAG: DUF4476 domain-containing protein [Chitinophagaceae bacterium]
MRKLALSLFFMLAASLAFSQRLYFIYLQTESKQAFFVKMDEKLYSSTASGYLILSRLKDSTYNFTIGFAGNQSSEQKFTCAINKKDHGYLVKNFGEKGWGLQDLQTASVQMAANAVDKQNGTTSVPVNAFTELLSKAADDSTLKQKIVLAEEKKPETVVAATEKKVAAVDSNTTAKVNNAVKPVADSVKKQVETIKESSNKTTTDKPGALVKSIPDTVEKKEATVIAKQDEKKPQETAAVENKVVKEMPGAMNVSSTEPYSRPKIIRKSESSTTEGLGITYVETQPGGGQDTIKILIPADAKATTAINTVKADPAVIQQPAPVEATTKKDGDSKKASVNNCKLTASDADFYKLRKKMASENSDVSMINEANKIFKTKCFTSAQIKNLSSMFLGDGGKYNFLDAAYAHVSDGENYPALESELKDPYFINRFKAMLR